MERDDVFFLTPPSSDGEAGGYPACPDCGAPLVPQGGCWICPACGFEACGVGGMG